MFNADIQHIRSSLSLLIQQPTREYYFFTSGTKAELNIEKINSEYSFLLSEEKLDFIKPKLTDKEEYLTEVNPYLYCARYLRAWKFQAVLKTHLGIYFGNDWYIKKYREVSERNPGILTKIQFKRTF